MAIAQFIRVSKRFAAATAPAVDAVSFDLELGEFFSLLGPSGCGKTTTLRLLAGLETADGGEIWLGGERAESKRPYQRRLGMVFQNYALFPHLNVERNVAFGLQRHRVPRAEIPGRVERALEMVQLNPAEFSRRVPSELSGGQRQRVALARALVLEPDILLLDEPLGAIDLKLRKAMQLELKQLNRSLGITFVYVTHDQDEALTMSDRIAVMDRGRIVQLGSPAEIYENPRTAFVATFIGESNLLTGRVVARSGELWEVAAPDGSRMLVSGAAGIIEGSSIQLAIRPEWMDLFSPHGIPSGENAIQGTVDEVIYLGEMLRVLVALPGGARLAVAVRNEGQLTRPLQWRRGDAVAVGWRPEDCQLLEES